MFLKNQTLLKFLMNRQNRLNLMFLKYLMFHYYVTLLKNQHFLMLLMYH
jgi:hypothetical protein